MLSETQERTGNVTVGYLEHYLCISFIIIHSVLKGYYTVLQIWQHVEFLLTSEPIAQKQDIFQINHIKAHLNWDTLFCVFKIDVNVYTLHGQKYVDTQKFHPYYMNVFKYTAPTASTVIDQLIL